MSRKYSYEEVNEFINSTGYKLISDEYIDAKTPLIIQCPKGHIFKRTFYKFKNNVSCPHCNKTRKLTLNDIKTEISKEGYTLLATKYKNNQTPLKMKCPNGHIINMTYGNFYMGKRCKCNSNRKQSGKKKLAYEYVKRYIENEGYKLLSKNYINNRTKLLLKCDKGHVFKMDFSHFKNNRRCSYCKNSKGNQKIQSILEKLKINHISEYKFKDCKFKKQLPFDFYLSDYNICIEYDGEQHFEIIEHFGGYNKFIDTKIRDTIKNIYCNENNIELIRIPYWEFDNIENIISNKLKINKK